MSQVVQAMGYTDHPMDVEKRSQNWDKASRWELIVSAVLAFMLLALASVSRAEGQFEEQYEEQLEERVTSLDELGSGSFVIAQSGGGYRALPRLNSEFSLKVSGMVVQAAMTQSFVNESDQWIEGQYVFPLPVDSAVNGMKIRIGERTIVGHIKEKNTARKLFVAARKQGKKASLIEQQRANLFTNHVTNIAPGERIDVELHYLQTLRYDHGEFSLRIPMTLTPRYIPGRPIPDAQNSLITGQGWAFNTDLVPDASSITPPQRTVDELATVNRLDSTLTNVATVDIALTPGFELASVTSPYHEISFGKDAAAGVAQLPVGNGRYHITTKQAWIPMNRDFVLRWKPVANQAPVAAFFNETIVANASDDSGGIHSEHELSEEESHHGLVLIMPPQQDYQPAGVQSQVTPRELVLVIDTSGSMAGTSMEQAKQALMLALQRLSANDYFNVVEFNSTTHRLFSQSVVASEANVNAAKRYVSRLQANGGTEMRKALEVALLDSSERGVDQSRVRQVVFITDGSVGNEASLFSYIVDHVGKSRLFTVAIGSAPNGYFMKKAAQFGRGVYTAIGSVNEVNEVMSQLFEKIERPLLTDVRVSFHNSKNNGVEHYPTKIPDLYANEPLLLMIKLSEKIDTITISGEYAGQYWQKDITPNWSANHEGVGTLWAREKIEYLMDEAVRQGNRDQFRDVVTRLGLDYKILSRYTSFVAIDQVPSRPHYDNLQQHKIANSMPAGSAQKVPSVAFPKTALGINELILSGLLSLFLGLLNIKRLVSSKARS